MQTEPLRKYQPIWEQIKTTGKCEIALHRAYHARAIKAVTKEKDIDLGFKLECSEMSPPMRAFLSSKRDGSVVRFKLELRPHITVDSI